MINFVRNLSVASTSLLFFAFISGDGSFGQVEPSPGPEISSEKVSTPNPCEDAVTQRRKLVFHREIVHAGITYAFRPARPEDVSQVTQLVRSAYAIWREAGIEVGSPLTQTDEITRSYILDHGFVVVSPTGKVVGSVSLEKSHFEAKLPNISVVRRGKPDTYKFSTAHRSIETFVNSNYLYLYRLCVSRELARTGLGTQVLELAEALSRSSKYAGIVLDTQTNTGWLYQWYLRKGYEAIGESLPATADDPVTILLVKDLPAHE